MLYDDGNIACDDLGLIVRRYYLWGSTKVIPYAAIQSVKRRDLTRWDGKFRIWGSSDFVHYYNLDASRPKKQIAIEIHTTGRIVPTITPDDPEAVEHILAERHGR